MFTGLIENLGTLTKWNHSSTHGRLFLQLAKPWSDVNLGESVAINGCCLTVVESTGHTLAFDVSDETLRQTTLLHLRIGDAVNLERAIQVGARLGGHFVLGHVDGVGEITARQTHAGSTEFRVGYPKMFAQLLLDKGSVAVDGISLTVCDLTENAFSVFIIPHTLQNTNLKHWQKNTLVNLEFDVLSKCILRQRQVSVSKL